MDVLRMNRLLFDPASVVAVRFHNETGFRKADITLQVGSSAPTLFTLVVTEQDDLKAVEAWVKGHVEVPAWWGGAKAPEPERSARKQPGQEDSQAANPRSQAT